MACRVVSTISCVDEYPNYLTVCISNDGNVYSFGKSRNKGHGHDSNLVFPPKMIPSLSKIVSVVCGAHHTVCLNHGSGLRHHFRRFFVFLRKTLAAFSGTTSGVFWALAEPNIYLFN